MTHKRVRPVRYRVALELVVDDGDALTPLEVEPVTINASEWQKFVDHDLAAAIEALEQAQSSSPPLEESL